MNFFIQFLKGVPQFFSPFKIDINYIDICVSKCRYLTIDPKLHIKYNVDVIELFNFQFNIIYTPKMSQKIHYFDILIKKTIDMDIKLTTVA